MLRLVTPDVDHRDAWLDARHDWGVGTHQDGSGLHDDDDVDTTAGFTAWVSRLRRSADVSTPPEPGRVHCTFWWIFDDDVMVGAIALRHELNDFLFEAGGHIGYGIRPSARRRGIASWALGEVLDHARVLGLERVLITCNDDNAASARTIEKHGGVLEDVRDTSLGMTRRYWIDLAKRDH